MVPVAVVGLGSGVANIAAGSNHTCAVTTGGGVQCWGDNYYGQLGNGTIGWSMVPVAVVGLGSGVAAIAGGYAHTCALTTGGGVQCWGRNWGGQLGNGTFADSTVPVAVAGLGSAVAAIETGWHHTCAVATGGGLLCWGSNEYGQLGDGYFPVVTTPAVVVGFGAGIPALGLPALGLLALALALAGASPARRRRGLRSGPRCPRGDRSRRGR
jgi:alpha-tubulin suppressor-like RCC1 family protein